MKEINASPSELIKNIQQLTDQIRTHIKEGDFTQVKNNLTLAETYYRLGSIQVKNTIENIFIYSFSSLICLCRDLRSLIPETLYSVYVQQMYKTGI